MAEPAVIQATYADWRTVKTRKLLQIIFEVPIEQQAHVLSVLGAPLGDSATWVAIARLEAPTAPPERAPEPEECRHCADYVGRCPFCGRDRPSPVEVREQAPARSLPQTKPRNPDAADRAREAYHADNEMGKAARLAGMLRKDLVYRKWTGVTQVTGETANDYAERVALWQRTRIGVESCSEIATDPLAYERWKQHLLAFEMATGRAARPS